MDAGQPWTSGAVRSEGVYHQPLGVRVGQHGGGRQQLAVCFVDQAVAVGVGALAGHDVDACGLSLSFKLRDAFTTASPTLTFPLSHASEARLSVLKTLTAHNHLSILITAP